MSTNNTRPTEITVGCWVLVEGITYTFTVSHPMKVVKIGGTRLTLQRERRGLGGELRDIDESVKYRKSVVGVFATEEEATIASKAIREGFDVTEKEINRLRKEQIEKSRLLVAQNGGSNVKMGVIQ